MWQPDDDSPSRQYALVSAASKIWAVMQTLTARGRSDLSAHKLLVYLTGITSRLTGITVRLTGITVSQGNRTADLADADGCVVTLCMPALIIFCSSQAANSHPLRHHDVAMTCLQLIGCQ